MGQSIQIGVSGVSREVKQPSIGVGGVLRNIENGFIGVGGVARQFYTALADNLSVVESEKLNYWTYFAFYSRWKYDSDTTQKFVMSLTSAMVSDNGYDCVDMGGTIDGVNSFLAYVPGSVEQPSKYAAAFFCPSYSHANAMVKCIQNNYTKMAYSWINFWADQMNPKSFSSYLRTIQSVTNLGKCSDIGYKIYYTSDRYYDFSTVNGYKDLYVVEILLNENLHCGTQKGSNCMPVVVFTS